MEKELRKARLTAEVSDLQRRLANNGYKAGEPMEWKDWNAMPAEHHRWQTRLWYVGRALTDDSLPEVAL